MTTTASPTPGLTGSAMTSYAELPNLHVRSDNGVDYAYRSFGADTRPLIFLQHFRGNLDNWDPALMDDVAADRRVVAFDNVGVGGTSASTPSTVQQMALDAIAFIDALGLDEVDLMGFSIGSFVAQEIALIRPSAVRRLILASAAPQGAPGMHRWAPDVIAAVGAPDVDPAGVLRVF